MHCRHKRGWNVGIRISDFMRTEHELIERKVKDLEAGKITFSELKGVLESHFGLEEKAIFDGCDIETFNQVKRLFWEHKTILGQIGKLKNDLNSTGSMDFSRLKALLIRHKEEEDESFYPMLDEKLIESQKKKILSNLKKMKSSSG